MQNRYSLPPDVRRSALEIVRGYPRRVAAYRAAREMILQGQPCRFAEYSFTVFAADGSTRAMTARQYFPHGSGIGDPTADKALRLAALDGFPESQRMRAVETAIAEISADVAANDARKNLQSALLESCANGRGFVFEHKNLPTSKSAFYRRRARFLFLVAKKTGFF